MSDVDVASLNRAERRRANSNRQYEIKPIRFTVADVAVMLRCTKVFVFKLIKSGELKATGSRRKVWVSAASLDRYIAELPEWHSSVE